MAKLSDLRTTLVKGAFKVMQSPRFVRLLQDRRVLNILVDGMSLRARSRVLLREAGAAIARSLGLATMEDLRCLEHDLRSLSRVSPMRAEETREPTLSVRDRWKAGDAADSLSDEHDGAR